MPRCEPYLPKGKIVFVAEAPGEQESFFGFPLIGASGYELAQMLTEAGILDETLPQRQLSPLEMISLWKRHDIGLTNVFLDRPPNNKIEAFCASKKEVTDASLGHPYTYPPIRSGKYVRPEYLHEVDRLHSELRDAKPNLIVALGGVASWALIGNSAITKVRGAVVETELGKVLPTYHPAYILRAYGDRPIGMADLFKARYESGFPDVRRPVRHIWINPTISDLWEFKKRFLDNKPVTFFDIETARGQITCIGFASSPDVALVVPFVAKSNPNYSYWPTLEEEVEAIKFVREVLTTETPKGGQNGLYDLQYLINVWKIQVRNYVEDTMILHHALQPEIPKGLGFLGSIYTSEASWKLMRDRAKETLKREDE